MLMPVAEEEEAAAVAVVVAVVVVVAVLAVVVAVAGIQARIIRISRQSESYGGDRAWVVGQRSSFDSRRAAGTCRRSVRSGAAGLGNIRPAERTRGAHHWIAPHARVSALQSEQQAG